MISRGPFQPPQFYGFHQSSTGQNSSWIIVPLWLKSVPFQTCPDTAPEPPVVWYWGTVQKEIQQTGWVPSPDNDSTLIIAQTDQDLCQITLTQTSAMLRKIRLVISPFPLFPEAEKTENTVVKIIQVKQFNAIHIMQYCSHQQRALFQVRSQTKARTHLPCGSLAHGKRKGGQHGLPLALPV